MMNANLKPALLILAGMALLLAWRMHTAPEGCRRKQPPGERTWPVMGTFASVTLSRDDAASLDPVAAEAGRILEDINRRMSIYLPDSEMAALNGGGDVPVSDWTRDLLETSRHYATLSEGAFDPTVMPLVRLWGFSGAAPPDALPGGEAIAAALAHTGIAHLQINGNRAGFNRPGMTFDPGGIAKGFAVDRCYDAIIGRRPKLNVIINLGGNLRVHGRAGAGRDWRIGVRHPFEPDRTIGTLNLKSGMAVATSGNYERFVVIEGRRYAHIVDPRSGYPVSGMAGVTVLSPNATEADALSTALFVTGLRDAGRILAKAPESDALLVPDRLPIEIHVSGGMLRVFEPLPRFEKAVKRLEALDTHITL